MCAQMRLLSQVEAAFLNERTLLGASLARSAELNPTSPVELNMCIIVHSILSMIESLARKEWRSLMHVLRL